MQEHTNKDTEVRARSTNPIHIVPTSRQAGANADALREVHMSLVRAEQNLYNLVQASHATGQTGFGYSAPAFAPGGYAAPSFPPGFAPAAAITQPSFGFATQPNGMGTAPVGYNAAQAFTPGTLAYPQSQVGFAQSSPAPSWTNAPSPSWTNSQWNPLTTVAALPGVIAAGLSAISGALAASVAALPGTSTVPAALIPGYAAPAWVQSRTPACDISDEGKAFVCHLDLPGLRADQVELLCLEQAIIVSAVREADGESVSLVQAERGAAMQQRTIVLPAPIQAGAAKASLSNGILTVTLPKVNPTEGPRRIKVQG